MEQRFKKTISLILTKSNSVKEKCGQVRKKTTTKQGQVDALEWDFAFQGISVLLEFYAA